MLKTVHEILNKLALSQFDVLLERIQALNISTEDQLSGVVKLLFEKVNLILNFVANGHCQVSKFFSLYQAVDHPVFSSTYAKMCQALSTKEVISSANPAETTNFRKLLLTRCQKEFEKGIDVENKKKEIVRSVNYYLQPESLVCLSQTFIFQERKKKEANEELEELDRRRSLGNIR